MICTSNSLAGAIIIKSPTVIVSRRRLRSAADDDDVVPSFRTLENLGWPRPMRKEGAGHRSREPFSGGPDSAWTGTDADITQAPARDAGRGSGEEAGEILGAGGRWLAGTVLAHIGGRGIASRLLVEQEGECSGAGDLRIGKRHEGVRSIG